MACLTLPGTTTPAPAEPLRATYWHIVDLPEASHLPEAKIVELCVQFNRDAEVLNPDLACRIELYSFQGLTETAESQLKSEEYLAAAISHFETDSDPQTWETALSRLQLSPDADFVLLGISGFADRISLPSGEQRFSGHYADGIQLKLTDFNQNPYYRQK